MKKIIISILLFLVLIVPICWSLFQKGPDGTSFEGDYHEAEAIDFLVDFTFLREGKVIHELNILKREISMIEAAQEFILMDMFLFNDAYDRNSEKYPNAVASITNALIEKRKLNPDMPIVFITDPINGFYGAYEEEAIQSMRDSDIQVILTDLTQMKDSNPLFSGYYRAYIKWFGTKGKGWIENPTDTKKPKVNIRNFLGLLNLKANHRKLLITDQEGMITSANPHDASSYHSNVAVVVKSPVLNDMIEAERRVAIFSGEELPYFEYYQGEQSYLSNTKVKYLTEKAIYNRLLECIRAAKKGDKIQIGMFYLSEFSVIDELEKAAKRGVLIELIADPNKNAFGVKMNGSPNCQSLSKLGEEENFTIKWYNIGEEQYHVKLASFTYPVHNIILMGSANYTRRNLKGYNLESDLEIVTVRDTDISKTIQSYFKRLWNNEDGDYTVEFKTYANDDFLKYKLYQIQEATGISSY
ncbi:phospholipase D-like domain-containing protein [Sinanaerobacter sp. ZZT-01]|uniref:phospholipase D-like domain-containing protein n=1 Tax=Sinanaerobacter sp. ZZT-01 TaxID=3111540 RepID=UPI002D782441|nr:phospholipase D-like domain-containing protein [Sinanaerobacter sp. ZZT-01]WRR92172.1 phospholipase D-like domain-containing protein [Sinanaerobacter sp. ZZT-01]